MPKQSRLACKSNRVATESLALVLVGLTASLALGCGSSDAANTPASSAGAAGSSGLGGSGTSGASAGGTSGGGTSGGGTSGGAGTAGSAAAPCPPFVGTPSSGQALCAWLLGKQAGQGVGQDTIALVAPSSGGLLAAGSFVGSIDFGAGPIADKPATGASDGASAFVTTLDDSGRASGSKTFGTTGVQFVSGLASDASGAVVLVGSNTGDVDFGGGTLSATGNDGFVAKLDAARAHVFSKPFAATFAGVGVDAAGHIHGAGSFVAPLSFGGPQLANSSGSSAIFVLELDGDGAHRYSASLVATNGAQALAFASDAAGDVAIVGTYNGTIDFGGGHTLTSAPTGAFVLVLDAAHAFVFAQPLGLLDGFGAAVTFDAAGNVIVVGSEHADTDFGGGTLVNAGGADLFIAKYGPSGSYIDSRVFGDGADQRGRSLATDAAGNLLVAGMFAGTMSFAGSDLSAQSTADLFLLSFDADLTPRWQHAFDNAGAQASHAVATFDASGNVWLSGSIVGAAPNFGTGALASEDLDRRAFFAKFAF